MLNGIALIMLLVVVNAALVPVIATGLAYFGLFPAFEISLTGFRFEVRRKALSWYRYRPVLGTTPTGSVGAVIVFQLPTAAALALIASLPSPHLTLRDSGNTHFLSITRQL